MPASRRSSPASPAETFVVPVAGMTCRSCERRIERNLRAIPAVKRAAASATRGQVIVQVAAPVSDQEIAAAIEAAGYSVGTTPWMSRDRRAWATVGAAALGLAGVAVLVSTTGLTELGAGAGDIRSGGLVVALLLGLAAGVSTCLALTGGLVLALSAAYEARRDPSSDAGVIARLRPSAVFVTSRVVGFTLLGMGLGAIGASVTMPPMLTAVLMIAVAVVMTLLGARLTGLSPKVAAWSPTLPSGLARAIGVHEGSAATYSDTRAAALGVASFFLPCGFTQAVQVYALSTGSPAIAGAILGVFALGTAPGLLALGGLPAIIPPNVRPTALRVVGVVVIGFALLNGAAGLRLLGVSPDLGGPTVAGPAPDVTFEDGVQVLRTFQVANGYEPVEASLYAGVPTRWIVESLEGGSCAIFMQAPALGLQILLQEGENVIELPALGPGRVDYTCSMGMYSASLRVVEGAPEAFTGSAGG